MFPLFIVARLGAAAAIIVSIMVAVVRDHFSKSLQLAIVYIKLKYYDYFD